MVHVRYHTGRKVHFCCFIFLKDCRQVLLQLFFSAVRQFYYLHCDSVGKSTRVKSLIGALTKATSGSILSQQLERFFWYLKLKGSYSACLLASQEFLFCDILFDCLIVRQTVVQDFWCLIYSICTDDSAPRFYILWWWD